MKSTRFNVNILIFTLACLFLSIWTVGQVNTSPVEMVYINEVQKVTELNWGKLDQAHYPVELYKFEIVQNNQQDYNKKINDAIKQHETLVDVTQGTELVGKLIFYTNYNKQYGKVRHNLIFLLIAGYFVLTVMVAGYLIFLRRRVFNPFTKLKNFASSVAGGNLDLPLEMDRGNVFGAFSESFDMMREALKNAKHKEYLANLSKKELVASLSHDIKTPISSIKAISELMLVKPLDEKMNQQMHIIYDKAEQINRLITDMFHATLEEMGELKVKVSEQSSLTFEELLKQADYLDKIKIGKIPECMIWMDPLRVQQVLDNIINNCYKYAGTSIDVLFTLNTNYLEMDINDYGKGVNEEELPLLFNKFYRGGNIQGQNGAGLGLYIAQYFMEKQEGGMECFNRVDGFTIKLFLKLV